MGTVTGMVLEAKANDFAEGKEIKVFDNAGVALGAFG